MNRRDDFRWPYRPPPKVLTAAEAQAIQQQYRAASTRLAKWHRLVIADYNKAQENSK